MTLAVLSLAEGLRVLSAGTLKNTCIDFHEYVRAAREAGQEEIAVQELRRLAAATESVTVRERMAEFLNELGDAEGARAILDGTPLAATPSVEADEDQNTRWVQILLGPTVEA
jgi:thioredoxin-like negative regulator of GroEL